MEILKSPHIHTLNCRGRLLSLEKPRVMGILNLTPDSFSDGGKYTNMDQALAQTERMLAEGATIIDIGGYSSRPGAAHVSEAEELARIEAVTARILETFPEVIISVDTFRPGVARRVLDLGAHIINDITAGFGHPDSSPDAEDMFTVLARYGNVPLIVMHMAGTPQTMQNQPPLQQVVSTVADYLVGRVNAARQAGLRDIILDPGFGFGKTLTQNYEMLLHSGRFVGLGLPVLAGISRKSMLYRLFDTTPDDVLPLAAALHLKLLEAGVHILRVHDVREAARMITLYEFLRSQLHDTPV
ncbi:MAG: dihydropteroate synthase [Bacteroidia bacterium]|nr:dihydropteroate synthase [Bacteroidia bacterium]